jgi:hypothetical protein
MLPEPQPDAGRELVLPDQSSSAEEGCIGTGDSALALSLSSMYQPSQYVLKFKL